MPEFLGFTAFWLVFEGIPESSFVTYNLEGSVIHWFSSVVEVTERMKLVDDKMIKKEAIEIINNRKKLGFFSRLGIIHQ